MGRSRSAVISIASSLCIALLVSMASAQQQPQRPRAPAPIKPYQAVATTLPVTVNDPSFEAFRRQLGEIAVRKDKAGLARWW